MRLSEIRRLARVDLQGKWFLAVELFLLASMLPTGAIWVIQTLIGTTSLWSTVVTTLFNFFAGALLGFSQYWISLKIVTKQPLLFKDLNVGFSRPLYQPLVVINFVSQIMIDVVFAVGLIPFMKLLGQTNYWQTVLGGISQLETAVLQSPEKFTNDTRFLLVLMVILVIIVILGIWIQLIVMAQMVRPQISVWQNWRWLLTKMWGHHRRLAGLAISFLPWAIVILVTGGFAYFFIQPYFATSIAKFCQLEIFVEPIADHA